MRAAEAIRSALLQRADRPVIFDTYGRSLSGNELVERVDRLTGKLFASGLQSGTVGLWYRNCFAAVEAFLAVDWFGGTRIAVDPNAPPTEALATFEAAGVELIVCDRSHADMIRGSAMVHDDQELWLGEPRLPKKDIDPDKPSSLYPRAVINGRLFAIPCSYGNWDAILRINVGLYRAGKFGDWGEETECYLSAQQIMHATGFLGTFPFLMMGRPQVVADEFSAPQIVDAIELHGVTATMLVPQMLTRLVDAAQGRPGTCESLRHILYGGGPIDGEDVKRALRRFGPTLSQVYGRMEGGWPIAVLGTEEHRSILAGNHRIAESCGRSIDSVSVRLRPVSSRDSDEGELCVSSDMNVAEYMGADGYCSLGDIMQQDENGYLYFRGRLDRMINTGYHIYPAEIEDVISRVPGVLEVLVTGEPSREWGETVVAYVVCSDKHSSELLIASIKREISNQLARYKMPRKFCVVDELPT